MNNFFFWKSVFVKHPSGQLNPLHGPLFFSSPLLCSGRCSSHTNGSVDDKLGPCHRQADCWEGGRVVVADAVVDSWGLADQGLSHSADCCAHAALCGHGTHLCHVLKDTCYSRPCRGLLFSEAEGKLDWRGCKVSWVPVLGKLKLYDIFLNLFWLNANKQWARLANNPPKQFTLKSFILHYISY